MGNLCGWNWCVVWCKKLWLGCAFIVTILAWNIDNTPTDWHTNWHTILTTNNIFFEYIIFKFLYRSSPCDRDGNDAEKHTAYAESDDNEEKVKQGNTHLLWTLLVWVNKYISLTLEYYRKAFLNIFFSTHFDFSFHIYSSKFI